ncbi:MAG: hypothetical protein H8D78_15515 [Chloroflexi bacterium]|nr:hypothetical protein [Chloroflexota bacterium]
MNAVLQREMNTTIVVSRETARHLESLPLIPSDVDSKLRSLLEAEYRRRLSRYSLTDRMLQQKYGMTYEEFEVRNVVEERGYSWEVESDAIAWETASDGMRTMQRKLQELLGPKP